MWYIWYWCEASAGGSPPMARLKNCVYCLPIWSRKFFVWLSLPTLLCSPDLPLFATLPCREKAIDLTKISLWKRSCVTHTVDTPMGGGLLDYPHHVAMFLECIVDWMVETAYGRQSIIKIKSTYLQLHQTPSKTLRPLLSKQTLALTPCLNSKTFNRSRLLNIQRLLIVSSRWANKVRFKHCLGFTRAVGSW